MFRWLLDRIRRPEMVVDEGGSSYRELLLKSIMLLREKVDRDGRPEVILGLHDLLKDLHDLEYRASVDAEQELRGELAKLVMRLEQLESIVGIRRLGPVESGINGKPTRGRIA